MAAGSAGGAPDEETLRGPWATAFGAQSLSDFCVFLRLRFLRRTVGDALEVCHELHYLQMACEKIAKAYRLKGTAVDIEKEMSGHVAFSQFIEGYLITAGYGQRPKYSGRPQSFTDFKKRVRRVAEDVEKLAPAVDREVTPSNAEYPWLEGNEIKTPCRYSYPSLHLLQTADPKGVEFLQIVQSAIEGFNGKEILETEGSIELRDKSRE